MILSRIRSTIVALAVLASASASSRAQDWTKLGTLPANARCGYFWDFYHGVVGVFNTGLGGSVGSPGIYWYDHGTWTKSKYPESPGAFNSIRELTPGHLYAAQGASQIWVSTDSGKTWDTTGIHAGVRWPGWGPLVPAQDVYLASDNTIHVVPGRLVGFGSSARVVGGGFSRIDPQHCVISMIDTGSTGAFYSNDGGLTWHPSLGIGFGGFGCYGDACRHVFYTASEDGPVYYSADSGVTWHPCASQLDAGAGDMDVLDGANGVLYKQTTSAGVFQSVDGGASWQWIYRSPKGSIEDTHIFPVGTFGSELVAFSGPDVWYATGADFNSKPQCAFSVGDTSLHECYPANVIPVLVRPTGIRHKLHFLTEADTTHLLLPNDTTILTPSQDSIVLLFHLTPPDIHGSSRIQMHAHLDDACFPFDWDSIFVNTIPAYAFGMSGNSVAIRACDSVIVGIEIHSLLCDSLMLSTIQVMSDSEQNTSLLPTARHLFYRSEADTIWIKYTPRGHVEDRPYSVHISGVLAPSNIPIDTIVILHLTAMADSRCSVDTGKASVQSTVPTISIFQIQDKELSFSFADFPYDAGSVEIVNILGDVVKRRKLETGIMRWDLFDLRPGVYFLRFFSEADVFSKQFVIIE